MSAAADLAASHFLVPHPRRSANRLENAFIETLARYRHLPTERQQAILARLVAKASP